MKEVPMPLDKTKYKILKLDCPAEKVLRITFDRPETYNSLDADGHRELAYIWRDIDDDPGINSCLLYTSPSTRAVEKDRMKSYA
mgnify:CR=1 FL=1